MEKKVQAVGSEQVGLKEIKERTFIARLPVFLYRRFEIFLASVNGDDGDAPHPTKKALLARALTEFLDRQGA